MMAQAVEARIEAEVQARLLGPDRELSEFERQRLRGQRAQLEGKLSNLEHHAGAGRRDVPAGAERR